jgi:hypothetical protein
VSPVKSPSRAPRGLLLKWVDTTPRSVS